MGERALAAVPAAPAGPWRPLGGAPWAWGVLLALLLALLGGVATYDWSGRAWFIGDESTYAMQAASVAFDLDLAYEKVDHERFIAHWGKPPEGLILQKVAGGSTLTFGKPPLYAVAVAPFVRLWPRHGAPLANVLFLAVALVLVARTFSSWVGPAAPLWAAAMGFSSVAFGYVFWVHADLFLMCLTAAGLALVYRSADGTRTTARMPEVYDGSAGELAGGRLDDTSPEAVAAERRRRRATVARWLVAGLLLGAVGASRPPYLLLLAPALLAARQEARARRALVSFLAGVLAIVLATVVVQTLAGGDWTAYGGERRGFYPHTGFPGIDFPVSEFDAKVAALGGNTTWLQRGFLSTEQGWALWRWNSLYFLVGQDIGILPYLTPILLGFAALSWRRGRWALLAAVLVGTAVVMALMPFNYFGGTGALANRYFLPLYPALVFLAGRPVGPRAAVVWPLLVTALAAPFLYPLWLAPRQFPVDAAGRYAYVSPLARRYLPYETTQSHIPGGKDVAHRGVWLKFLNDGVWPEEGGGSLRLLGGASGHLLVGSPQPLASLVLAFDGKATSELTVVGGTVGGTMFRPDGGVSFALTLAPPRAVHPMWWTWDNYYLYDLTLRMPGNPVPVGFTVEPVVSPVVSPVLSPGGG